MPKYFVPLFLVIEAEDEHVASGRADDILSSLAELQPKDYDGHGFVENLNVTEAPDNWLFTDTYLHNDCVDISVGSRVAE